MTLVCSKRSWYDVRLGCRRQTFGRATGCRRLDVVEAEGKVDAGRRHPCEDEPEAKGEWVSADAHQWQGATEGAYQRLFWVEDQSARGPVDCAIAIWIVAPMIAPSWGRKPTSEPEKPTKEAAHDWTSAMDEGRKAKVMPALCETARTQTSAFGRDCWPGCKTLTSR
jgi:hypothetical protein